MPFFYTVKIALPFGRRTVLLVMTFNDFCDKKRLIQIPCVFFNRQVIRVQAIDRQGLLKE